MYPCRGVFIGSNILSSFKSRFLSHVVRFVNIVVIIENKLITRNNSNKYRYHNIHTGEYQLQLTPNNT